MNLKLKIAIIVIGFIHVSIAIARKSTDGVAHHRLVRLHTILITSTAMLSASYYIWKRVNFAITKLFKTLKSENELPIANSNESESDFAMNTLLPSPNPVGNRRLRLICFQDIAQALMMLFLFLSHIAMFFYYIFLGPEPNVIAITSLSFIAAYAHILIFLLIADVLFYSTKLIHSKVAPNSVHTYLKENRCYHILLALILGFIFMFAGLYTTHTDPIVRSASIPMKRFQSNSGNVSIALLSDVHIGPSVGRTRIAKIVELTNALKPDIIAIAGDLADGLVRDFHGAAEPLCNLKAPGGVYFATGNHEYMHGNVTEWFWFLENCNITVLHNLNKHITVNGQKLCVAGADDLYALRSNVPGHGMDLRKALGTCNSDSTNILLAHQPNAAKIVLSDSELSKKVNLILSGHTHGGQMYPFVPIVHLANAFVRGQYYDKSTDTYVYVSAGVNYFGPPIKMFGSCEIIFITMTQ
ncbi:Putative metallophosphoesterase F40B5.2 [Caenorhabditis elegans]|nr:Putative metallophosphoesterase F40B5.2 [Caenorhabditis elegans]CCD70883.1 Putative metallophosphoesterase F40B5.2 [Caenorhabditis elegans]|eukprot:NP_509417.2 Putative metallophosphoesterase F40B5.2 [Caenorhabditis elegans]